RARRRWHAVRRGDDRRRPRGRAARLVRPLSLLPPRRAGAAVTRTLIAGVGNVFFSDDAFGVEVARRLATTPPHHARVVDFGIRTLRLAYELPEPVDACVVVDCVARGGAPGTLYVIEPEIESTPVHGGAHGMDVAAVFATVRRLGGTMPRTLVLGCEPATVEP